MPIHAMIEQEKGADGARGAARMHMRLETSGSLGGHQGSTVVIHNLSATGMLIETSSDLDIGQRIAVTLPERSEEHTSELQSLMRISYAVFCLKKKTKLMTSHIPASQ